MKSSCVSQLELLPPGVESSFAGVCAEAPTAIALSAVDANRREAGKAASPAGPKHSRRAVSPHAAVTGLEPMLADVASLGTPRVSRQSGLP